MTTKYELVTDMKPWEFLKAMKEGDTFFVKHISLDDYSHDMKYETFVQATEQDVINHLNFYRQVEVHWWDQLDGSFDNAVLGYVWDLNPGAGRFTMIMRYCDDEDLPFICSNFRWEHARPVTDEEMNKILDNTRRAAKMALENNDQQD